MATAMAMGMAMGEGMGMGMAMRMLMGTFSVCIEVVDDIMVLSSIITDQR